ncbi:uncharacterized protein AKAME5_001626500 [Lates japonicus]|uniref:Ig-like domain-containing protein n=1 Tax=Lates japonicus TaxID=270547 RepID=A0AAD3RC04_LATJO|nr:uncharacterized protein AKAME5_001626500 [Lates japonicus]
MRNTLLCVLGSLLLNRLLCGRTPAAAKEAVVTRHPNWPKIYREERITLRCEIKNGENSKWEYEWKTTTSMKLSNNDQFMITAYVFHNGYYKCRGRDISGQFKTKWSDAFKLTVYANKPRPVLTVSPSWLSPGASVTLNCKIEHPSAGWRFYWYKSVPKPAERNYRVVRLPGSTNGTEEDSYIIHGPTYTARYQCRVRRGHSVFYSHYSESEFVWSKDLLRFPSFRASLPQAQSSDQDQAVNQEQQYSSLLTDGRDKEYSDVVSHSIQLKRLDKRSEHDDPEERSDCNVNPLSTTES